MAEVGSISLLKIALIVLKCFIIITYIIFRSPTHIRTNCIQTNKNHKLKIKIKNRSDTNTKKYPK